MNRPVDFVYFSMIVIACVAGYLFSRASNEEDQAGVTFGSGIAHFEAPSLPLEEPDFALFSMPVFKARSLPKLQLSDQMEAVLREVRDGLLASAVPAREETNARLASLE